MLTNKDLIDSDMENTNMAKIEKEIDASMKEFHGWWQWECAIISGEYPVSVRDAIARKYKNEGGWNYVYHQTSSENGERGGLTKFIFCMNDVSKLAPSMVANMHTV